MFFKFKLANKVFIPALLLSFISLVLLFSISKTLFYSQIMKFIFLFLFFIFINFTSSVFWYEFASFFYIAILMVLGVNLAFSSGIKRWVSFAGFAMQFSEFAKLSLLLFLSKFLSKNKLNIMNFFKACFLIIIPFVFVFKQPDFGTSIIILFSGLAMIWLKGLNRVFLIFSSITSLGIIPYIWSKLLPYQKDRIFAFLNPELDKQGKSYQTIQSIIAVGSGGLLGSNALQNRLGFVPENHTDFIFSYCCEYGGFFLSSLVIFLIFYANYNLFLIFLDEKNLFKRFFIFGFMFIWSFESIMNIGMNLGLMPVTGVPLPFFSYGGSSLLTFCFMLGIFMNFMKEKVDL